jgi:hypothetical protein
MAEIKRGGLLLRVDGALVFIPASIALRISAHPEIVRVPGAPSELLGMAVNEGEILPVVAIGSDRGPMVVCIHASELVGLVGGVVIGSGIFPMAEEAASDEVSFGGETARTLDVARIFDRLRGGAWAGRWGG